MIKFNLRFIGLFMLLFGSLIIAQDINRLELNVPKVDPSVIKIDGVMDEAEWQNAAQANLITSTGYEIWTNKYYREDLLEPDYDEIFARMLWTNDTLYVFIHIDEFVNDSTNLFWDGQWTGDQLFVSLSNRLGVNMKGWYDGNVYAAPDGPYHFLIMGNEVTLNAGGDTFVPEEYRKCLDQSDSVQVFDASTIARSGITIDTLTGVWNVELAIYHPNVNAYASTAFNIGGSTGSRHSQENYGDAYAYYTWQPNVPNEPYSNPTGENDPGFYNLANSDYWAVLNFVPGQDDIVRKEVTVPWVDPVSLTLDGIMNETAWNDAAQANLITSTGYEIWTNKYYREDLLEPDYDEFYGRMLWSEDTLYVFIHIDEFVNDSTNLFWDGQWTGDQLFVGLSNRAAVNMMGWYDGNVYAAPDGPYHFLIMGEDVTLNNNGQSFVPEIFRGCFGDSLVTFNAADIARAGITIDTLTGVWNIEMAIYHPNVAKQGEIGFNIGGSTGSRHSQENYGDAYAYYTWQPNVPNEPYSNPTGENDPGFYTLANSQYWASLKFTSGPSGIDISPISNTVPETFSLHQNYPNPFNPTTNIRFDVTKQTPVTLKVYNVLGQVVATLIDGEGMTAGSYSVRWDAANLASGIYVYELHAEGRVSSMKMMLLK